MAQQLQTGVGLGRTLNGGFRMQIGDLVKIKSNSSWVSRWMSDAMRDSTPLLIIDQRETPKGVLESLYTKSQFKVMYRGEQWWVYEGALEELSKKCK